MSIKKVYILEDESLARELLKKYIAEDERLVCIGEASDGIKGLKEINELNPDLILLDIHLPRLSGFEVLEAISNKTAIIFTTAYEQHALQAFEVEAIDYLLKPISPERFKVAIDRWISKNPPQIANKTQHKYLAIKEGSELKLIDIQQIEHIEAYGDYVKITTIEKTFLKKDTIQRLEDELPKGLFFRTHRSHIVQLKYIKELIIYDKNSYGLKMSNQQLVPVSRTTYLDLKKELGVG